MTMSRRAVLSCVLLPLAAALPVRAAGYSDKPIRLVVAFAPGTGSDLIARILAQKLQDVLGQTVVVENRAGAGGTIGTAAVVRAPADGYTLTVGTNATLITAPLLVPEQPYRADADFSPLGGVARTPMLVVTGTEAGAPADFEELLVRARQPGASFASAGVGTIGHLTSEVLVRRLGLQASHVPYKGSPPSLTDVARGELLFASETPAAALAMVQAGRLKALAVTGETRLPLLPEVPTLEELGQPDLNLSVWWGLLGPSGLPDDVVRRLADAMREVNQMPDMASKREELALQPMPLSAGELGDFIRKEQPFWESFLSQADIRLQ